MDRIAPRDCFLAALRGEPTDRVPIFDWVNHPALYERELGQRPDLFDGRLAARVYRSLGLDACWVPAGGFTALPLERWHWQDENTFVDEWGTVYRREAGAWPLASPIAHPVKNASDWQALQLRLRDLEKNANADWRVQYATDALAEFSDDHAPLAVVAGLRGPFATAWMLMGLADMSYSLFDASDMLEEIFFTASQFWTTVGLRLIGAGVDALVIHDDMGSGNATFFSPRHMRQHVLPHLERQVAILADTGIPIILHSCGNINALLPDLAAMNIAGLNNLQRAAGMDLAAVKRAYGDRLCLIGNVDATGLLPFATPEEVEEAVRECLATGAPGGRYILATDHSFHEGIPLENIYAFIAAGKRYGSIATASDAGISDSASAARDPVRTAPAGRRDQL